MKRLMKLLAGLGLVAIGAGCSTPQVNQAKEDIKAEVSGTVDLGDGKIFNLVPVSMASNAADSAAPGAGKIVDLVAGGFKERRDARLGPFNGLPYTVERQVVLKTGVVIPQSEIENIIEVLTPIVPSAITRVVKPAAFSTQQVEPDEPAVTNSAPAEASPDAPVVDPDIEAELNNL